MTWVMALVAIGAWLAIVALAAYLLDRGIHFICGAVLIMVFMARAGTVGFVAYFSLWVFIFPVMATAALIVGIINKFYVESQILNG